jgi:hypothetical protein
VTASRGFCQAGFLSGETEVRLEITLDENTEYKKTEYRIQNTEYRIQETGVRSEE